MKIRVPTDQLRVGMFLVAEVRTLFLEGEMRHFLEPVEATYREATTKRMRLMQRRFEQVAHARGMLITSSKQLAALEQIGVTEVVVDTDKSDIIPDLPPPPREARAPRAQGEARSPQDRSPDTGWVTDLPRADRAPAPGGPPPPRKRTPAHRHVDIPGTERRRNFGPANAGWMKLEVTEVEEDGEPRLCAFLQVISFGGDGSMDEADVMRALEACYGIRAGIDRAMVRRLARQAAQSPNRVIRGEFLVASSPRRVPTHSTR